MPAFLTYDSSEVSKLVGIGPLLLNKFIERGSYGIRPSVRSGKGRGGRRLFGPDDVFGIALVWWLFESGLRSNVIQVVLDGICRTKNARADLAAKRLRGIQIVRILTEPGGTEEGGLKIARYRVHLITAEERAKIVAAAARGQEFALAPGTIETEIDVGYLYSVLRDKMQKLSGLPEGE